MQKDPIIIASIARTPQGQLLGELKTVTTPQLGATEISAAIERAHLTPYNAGEVIMGCVLRAGLGQAPADRSRHRIKIK